MTHQLAKDFQEVTEQINPLIERVERVFVKAGLTAVSQVSLLHGMELGFFMKNSLWRLQVMTAPGSWNLLVSMPRKIRLEALGALPRLEKAIRDVIDMTPEKAIAIFEEASSFVEQLESEVKR